MPRGLPGANFEGCRLSQFAECPSGDGSGECHSNVGVGECVEKPFDSHYEDLPTCTPAQERVVTEEEINFCSNCVTTFAQASGCELWRNNASDAELEALVPTSCIDGSQFECAEHAYDYCFHLYDKPGCGDNFPTINNSTCASCPGVFFDSIPAQYLGGPDGETWNLCTTCRREYPTFAMDEASALAIDPPAACFHGAPTSQKLKVGLEVERGKKLENKVGMFQYRGWG